MNVVRGARFRPGFQKKRKSETEKRGVEQATDRILEPRKLEKEDWGDVEHPLMGDGSARRGTFRGKNVDNKPSKANWR